MKGSGKGLVDFEFFPCFPHNLRCDLGASVRDDLLGKARSSPDMIQVELGGLFSHNGFPTWCNNDGFAEAIDNHKHGVGVLRFREVCDKVHGDDLPDIGRNLIWLERDMCLWFVLGGLADRTSVDVVFGIDGEARPSIFSSDQLVCLSSAWVSSCKVIVM